MALPAHLANAAITGGAGDIGSAIAAELLRHGAQVTIMDSRTEDAAADAMARLADIGAVRYREVDVTDSAAVGATIADIPDLGIVIGNAGIVDSAPFLEISPAQWQRHLDVNLTGCFNLGQAAARQMAERGTRGRIVFTSSWVQDRPWPEIAAYAVSKSGLKMLTECMAAELAEYGILVNAVAPGIVNAGMARRQLETEPQYARRTARAIPLGKMQTVDQVARSVMFLCSDAADYMTGSTLLIDGGCSLRP